MNDETPPNWRANPEIADSFVVTISDGNTGSILVTAKIERDGFGITVSQIQVSNGDSTVIPEELSTVDFDLIVRTARMLMVPHRPEPKLTGAEKFESGAAGPAGSISGPAGAAESISVPAEVAISVSETAEKIDLESEAVALAGDIVSDEDQSATPRNEFDRKSKSEDATKTPAHSSVSVPSDFGVNYWRLGSITKVARHYDVPNHIAKDWIASLTQETRVAAGKALLGSHIASIEAGPSGSNLGIDPHRESDITPRRRPLQRNSNEGEPRNIACPTCGTMPIERYGRIQLKADIVFRWLELDTAPDNSGGLIVTRHCMICQPSDRWPVSCAEQMCDEGPILGGPLAEDAIAAGGRVPEAVIRLLLLRGWSKGQEGLLICPQHSSDAGYAQVVR
ncbi:hypothetical protein AB0H71_33850 [Nocardia sp. NPDC050697]|uniref:hypothetical protein n=1 Tax=Nocardia sp. NPDC050697 TaxID=3155158 RepID=UPI0033F67C1C